MPQQQAPATSGADILVQCLVNHGVDTVFAYPGGASMPIHQALTRFEDRLRTILPRHEQCGGFMAEGYARCTGRVGVCIATEDRARPTSSPAWQTPRWTRCRSSPPTGW